MFCPGVLTSPGFPDDYPSNAHTSDTIAVNSNQLILITFTHFNVEEGRQCRYDSLEIRDGNGEILLGRTCGNSLPSEITSVSSEVHITFRSDHGVEESGWELNWKSVDTVTECPPPSSKPSPGLPCSAPGLECPYGEECCCDGNSMECGPSLTLACDTTPEGSLAWQSQAPTACTTQCGKYHSPFLAHVLLQGNSHLLVSPTTTLPMCT